MVKNPATKEIQIDDEYPVCPICLQELLANCCETDEQHLADCCNGDFDHKAVVTLHCGHTFHNICLVTWIEYKKIETKTNVFPCPYCKAKYVAYNNGSSFLIGKWRQKNIHILRLFIFFVFLVTAAGVYITSLQNF